MAVLGATATSSPGILSPVAGFGPPRAIEDPASGAHSAHAGDLDGEGDLDVAYFANSSPKLQIRFNQGGGVFGTAVTVSDSGAELDPGGIPGSE